MTSEAPDSTAVRQQLERILSSPGFVRNPRMSSFLRWLVERHLEGRDDELKESLIALEVFGRRPDYDPRIDSIVRTEAARLRARLAEYYAGDGATDPLRIEVPKGRYVPAVHQSGAAGREAPSRPWRWLAAGLAASILLLSVVALRLAHEDQSPVRVAVLPLRNLSPGGENEYFVDGLTDQIIRDLSVIEGLAVRSRTSSFVLKNRPPDLRETGRQLAADYLLEGSVLLVGDQLRVNVQLVRVTDESSVWSGRFDRRLADIFVIQDEIATGIVNNLRVHLGNGRRRYETSVEAYTLYLGARARSLRGIDGILQSIDGFEQAIEQDKSFAPAYAGLASAYAIRSVQFPLQHPPDELSRMRDAAERAVALDPLLAEAHAALGLARSRSGDWELAEASFRRAIALDPNDATTLTDFVMWHLNVLGRNEEALALLRRAESADPLGSNVQLNLAWVLMSLGRFAEAEGHCRRLPASHELRTQCLGRSLEGEGRHDDAVRLLTGDPALSQEPTDAGLSRLRARAVRQARRCGEDGERDGIRQRAGVDLRGPGRHRAHAGRAGAHERVGCPATRRVLELSRDGRTARTSSTGRASQGGWPAAVRTRGVRSPRRGLLLRRQRAKVVDDAPDVGV